MITIGIIVAILAIAIIWAISVYNGLVNKRANVQEGWSSIDVFLKKRNDLIPNLVETVKGYASHESSVLQNVVEARNLSGRAQTAKEQGAAESTMQNATMNLFAVAENYPDLKANSNFISLQQDLNALEDDIEMARRYYNGKVKENNVLPLQRDVIELPRDPVEGLAQNNGRYHQTETCAAFRQKVRRF